MLALYTIHDGSYGIWISLLTIGEKTLVTGGPADRHDLGLRASQCPAPDPAEFAVGAGGA